MKGKDLALVTAIAGVAILGFAYINKAEDNPIEDILASLQGMGSGVSTILNIGEGMGDIGDKISEALKGVTNIGMDTTDFVRDAQAYLDALLAGLLGGQSGDTSGNNGTDGTFKVLSGGKTSVFGFAQPSNTIWNVGGWRAGSPFGNVPIMGVKEGGYLDTLADKLTIAEGTSGDTQAQTIVTQKTDAKQTLKDLKKQKAAL